MSLVDAARRLADSAEYVLLIDGTGSDNDICRFCITTNGHDPDCPVPMLPQIVAVLEAAERVVQVHVNIEENEKSRIRPVTGGGFAIIYDPRDSLLFVERKAAESALRAALRGDSSP